MQNATYTIKIRDLLAIEDERKRWILVKKALAANVGQESTRAIEFGYHDLAHATERLIQMRDEQSETLTLPAGLEPADPSDNMSDTRVLLVAWAREVAVKPTMRVASRKGNSRPKPAPVVEQAEEIEEIEELSVAEVAQAPVAEASDIPVEETIPETAEAVAGSEAGVTEDTPELPEDVPTTEDTAEADREPATPEVSEAEPDMAVSYPISRPVPEAEAASDEAAGEFISDFIRTLDEDEVRGDVEQEQEVASDPDADEPDADEPDMAADTPAPEAGALEGVEAPVPEEAEGEALAPTQELEPEVAGDLTDETGNSEASEEAGQTEPAPETALGTATYAVDIEAVLAVSDKRIRRILSRKAAAFVLKRRYTSSIGKFVRDAGSIEDLLRKEGTTLHLPVGYEPVDSTDKGEGAVSLAAFAEGGEAAAVVGTPIPVKPVRRRGRPPKAASATKPDAPAPEPAADSGDPANGFEIAPVEAEVEVPAVADTAAAEALATEPAVETGALVETPVPSSRTFLSVISEAVAEAIAPYMDGGRFRDGKEGVAASEYLARSLEAEAALVRLRAFGRGGND